MKKQSILLGFVFGCLGNVWAQHVLTVEITNLHISGVVQLELLDANQKTIVKKQGMIENKKSILTLENLKTGAYAIRYFYDENSNDKVDTNLMGIPNEGYGCSNNAYGSFGPLPFDKSLFEVKGDAKITLVTKY